MASAGAHIWLFNVSNCILFVSVIFILIVQPSLYLISLLHPFYLFLRLQVSLSETTKECWSDSIQDRLHEQHRLDTTPGGGVRTKDFASSHFIVQKAHCGYQNWVLHNLLTSSHNTTAPAKIHIVCPISYCHTFCALEITIPSTEIYCRIGVFFRKQL